MNHLKIQPRAFAVPMLCAVLASGTAASNPMSAAAAEAVAEAFLERHCVRCHQGEKAEGQFRLDTLPRDFASLATAEKWAEAMTRINAGEMPPAEESRPTNDEIATAVDWIASGLKEGEAARMAARGDVTHYRLSREEYATTIRDLLGVHFDVNQPGATIEDPRWHGFERIGSMLSLSPAHVERSLRAAELVLQRAFPEKPSETKTHRVDAVGMLVDHRPGQGRINRDRAEKLGVLDKVRVAVWPGSEISAFNSKWWQLREPGLYRARMQVSGLRPPGGRAPHLTIWDASLKRSVFDADIVTAEHEPVIVEFEQFLTMPVTLGIQNEVAGKLPEGPGNQIHWFVSGTDTRLQHPTGYKLTDDEGQAIYPLLLIDWVEWEGPIVTDEGRQRREGLYPADVESLSEVRDCLRRFAERAWRRPVTDAEVDRYVRLYEGEKQAGEPPRAAFLCAMAGVLASKNFGYLEEGSPGARRDRVNDWELASRLSYFLWGSMPDDALFDAARAGTLHEPETLRSHVARMAADPKIERFLAAFPRQWLQLHRVGMFPPDPKIYPDYDRWLEASMTAECTEFFREVFRQNLPIREFLDSDWTMLNRRLAEHYGVSPPAAQGFARVSLRPEDHRGGLLTQAAVLVLSSDGTRHRPVHRGVWVSESIFGTTPPPPPPNVEPLEPTPAEADKATVRMQLAAHSTHAACAACHQKIDPLGFAFDNYDAIGRWRTTEKSAGKGEDPPVDATGTLADGRSFAGPEEFKTLLVDDIDRFAEAFVGQLATFALRRAMTIDDAAAIRQVAAACRADGYRLRSLIESLMTSDLFLKL
jgi:mono/diheme cytochrome c family protein